MDDSHSPLDPRYSTLQAGQVVAGRVVSWSDVGVFVNCDAGRDLLVHPRDVWKIARGSVPDIGAHVRGRVSPMIPQSGRVGLVPNWPGHDEPFPIGMCVSGTLANRDALRQFVRIDASVDGVIERAQLAGNVEVGTTLQVRIVAVDWRSDPRKVLVKLAPATSRVDAPEVARPRASGPNLSSWPSQATFLVDLSNTILRAGRALPNEPVQWVESALRRHAPSARILSVLDRSTLRQLSAAGAAELFARQAQGDLLITFDGVPADVLLLAAARQLGAIVVTDDLFADWPAERIGVPLLRSAVAANELVPRSVETHLADGTHSTESLEEALARAVRR